MVKVWNLLSPECPRLFRYPSQLMNRDPPTKERLWLLTLWNSMGVGGKYNILQISPKLKMTMNNSKIKISSDQWEGVTSMPRAQFFFFLKGTGFWHGCFEIFFLQFWCSHHVPSDFQWHFALYSSSSHVFLNLFPNSTTLYPISFAQTSALLTI